MYSPFGFEDIIYLLLKVSSKAFQLKKEPKQSPRNRRKFSSTPLEFQMPSSRLDLFQRFSPFSSVQI